VRNFLIRLVVNALALSLAAWMVGGIELRGGIGSVLLVALVFGILLRFLVGRPRQPDRLAGDHGARPDAAGRGGGTLRRARSGETDSLKGP
jgi:hypothetical protein